MGNHLSLTADHDGRAPKVFSSMPVDVVSAIDAARKAQGDSRSAWIRDAVIARLIAEGATQFADTETARAS